MATEFGLFNDEGCVEAGFYSVEEAAKASAECYSEEDELMIEEICPDHPEHAKHSCELCNAEEEEEEEEEEC